MAFASCGESDENDSGAGGTAGVAGQASGGSKTNPPLPDPVFCGKQTCRAISLPGGGAVAPCCVDAVEGICGAELALIGPTMGCQPLTQSGTLDSSCPSSMGLTVGGFPVPPFPGCCQEESGQCGVMIGDLGGLLPFAPGCVAGATQAGETPRACGAGSGAGGATAGGGAGGDGAEPEGGSAGEGEGNGGAGTSPGGSGGNEGGAAGSTQTVGDSGSGGSSGTGGSSGEAAAGDSGSVGEGGAQSAGASGSR